MLKKSLLIISSLFLFILLFSVNTYATEYFYPKDFKLSDGSLPYDFIVYKDGSNNYYALAFYEVNGFSDAIDASWITYKLQSSATHVIHVHGSSLDYKYGVFEMKNNSSQWTLLNTYKVAAGESNKPVNLGGSPIYSTFTLYYNGWSQVFFQKTPVKELTTLEAIMLATEEMSEEIVQTTKIILPYGVTCLALLIGLILLVKVFRH